MFRTFRRKFLPNPFNAMIRKVAKKKGKKILLVWNRGLGDIALGLYAMVLKIREIIFDAEITFLTRQDLLEGFSLLENVNTIIDPQMQRGIKYDVSNAFNRLNLDLKSFDLIIEKPSPSDWVTWQRGKITPKLKFSSSFLFLHERFQFSEEYTYIAVQPVIETTYGTWRNWPLSSWMDLLDRLEKFPKVKVVLVGSQKLGDFPQKNIIDLRGQTTLFELLSLICQKFDKMILQDSGILSMAYYLDYRFPIELISLWADPNHGILKQNVASPNLDLQHFPCIAPVKDLSTLSVDVVMDKIFNSKPLLKQNLLEPKILQNPSQSCVCILAGGQGSRLGVQGPKGVFKLYERSLFSWICSKVAKDTPICVMTSPDNHDQTVDFFLKNQMFDRQIYFFTQELLPFLDGKKRPLKYLAPSGNGSFYSSFKNSFVFDLLKKKNIQYAHIINVDNPMGLDVEGVLENILVEHNVDVAIRTVAKKENVSMGMLTERGGFVEVREYLYLDPKQHYECANIGAMTMSFSFIEKIASKILPIHWVEKTIPQTGKKGFKQESFIFDAFVYGKVLACCFDEQKCYFPIKDFSSPFPAKALLEEGKNSRLQKLV